MTETVLFILAVCIAALVTVGPLLLMILLIYHGEKSRRRPKRPPKRGFEVLMRTDQNSQIPKT